MAVESAGLLMYRIKTGKLYVFLVHPGGPFFSKKEEGWWTIPKGLPLAGEEFLAAARREFEEETGLVANPPFLELGYIKQKGGKTVYGWAFEGNWDPASSIRSNSFKLEWPPKSGRIREFPEVDKAAWMGINEATLMINDKQRPFLERLEELLPKL